MKRIIGTVVAIAGVLAFSTLATAAPVLFNLTGTAASVTSSTVATVPCGGGVAGGCFTNPLSPGSFVNLDITGTDVTILGGTLEIDAVVNIFGGAILITTDVTASISGGHGVLTGDQILWDAPAAYSFSGTFICTGLCNLLPPPAPPANVVLPIGLLFGANTQVNPVGLGVWDLNGTHDAITGSTRTTTSYVTATGVRASWLLWGPTDNGFLVPEPGSAALVLLGLGALALRSRKA